MKTEIIPASEIQTALEVLQNGGIVAFPTDTVYGLGALAVDNSAIESIYVAKKRPIEKAIPVLVGDVKDFDLVASSIPEMAKRFAENFLPGPLTCVVPKKSTLPPAISATDTVAVRIPNHPDALNLLRAAGAMAEWKDSVDFGCWENVWWRAIYAGRLHGRDACDFERGSDFVGAVISGFKIIRHTTSVTYILA
jgi:L-threonylcarbamoyladenylate synthase